MPRIKSIQLHNYKFFNEQEPINLEIDGECKHLLLYGENGSGKSSIFWGLHTLFESSLKEEEDIQKYFKHRDESPESLVNIYAERDERHGIAHYNSFIEVITNEEENNVYKVSLFDLEINQNVNAQLINKTSEFLSYKDLFEFQRFWNGQPMNLAQIVINTILPFIEFPESVLIRHGEKIKITNAYQKWLEIKKGPGTTFNHKQKEIQVYKSSPENIAFNKFVNEFNNNIEDLIDFINVNAPLIIRKLGYEIDFNLKYIKPYIRKADVKYEFRNFEIEFIVTSYLGSEVTIHRPQSFFNEAKISAIALAIRLSVLKMRVSTRVSEIPKFIVFDDLMISLDMNNRDKLLDFILNPENRFTSDYQILFLTHDKNLFEFIGTKIKQWDSLNNWKINELYSSSGINNEYPVIIDSELGYIEKAEKYFKAKDFVAASLYLRKEFEKTVKERLPKEYARTVDGEYHNLAHYWKLFREHFKKLKIDMDTICPEMNNDFEQSKTFILNRQAHHNLSDPVYTHELRKVFSILNDIKTKFPIPETIILISKGMVLEFFHPSENYSIQFELLDDLRVDKIGTESHLNIPDCSILTWQFNDLEFWNFSKEAQLNHKPKPTRNKLGYIKNNLIANVHVPLNITNEMFVENIFIKDSIWNFNDIIQKANIKDEILAL